jgi:hypothetical protein
MYKEKEIEQQFQDGKGVLWVVGGAGSVCGWLLIQCIADNLGECTHFN